MLSKAESASKFVPLPTQFRINEVSLAAGDDDHLPMVRIVNRHPSGTPLTRVT